MTKPKARLWEVHSRGRRWLHTAAVCARYDISETTLSRWLKDPRIDFPQPMRVTAGGGNFFAEDELDQADRRRRERTDQGDRR